METTETKIETAKNTETIKKCGCQSEQSEPKTCCCHKKKHLFKVVIILVTLGVLYLAWRKGYIQKIVESVKT